MTYVSTHSSVPSYYEFDNQFIVKFKISMVRDCVCEAPLPLVQIISFSCSFPHKSCQMISFRPLLRGWLIRPSSRIPRIRHCRSHNFQSNFFGNWGNLVRRLEGGFGPLRFVKIVREKTGLKSWPDTRFHFHCPFDFGSTMQEINHYREYWWSMNGFIKVKIS